MQLSSGDGTLVLTTENKHEVALLAPLQGRTLTITFGEFKEARYIDHQEGLCAVVSLGSGAVGAPKRDDKGRFLPADALARLEGEEAARA